MKANLLLAAVVFALWLVLASLRSGAAQSVTTPAEIVITTNGTTHQVDVEGGGVGYPGPSDVVLEYDEHGVVVVTRVRLWAVFDERVYLAWVAR